MAENVKMSGYKAEMDGIVYPMYWSLELRRACLLYRGQWTVNRGGFVIVTRNQLGYAQFNAALMTRLRRSDELCSPMALSHGTPRPSSPPSRKRNYG